MDAARQWFYSRPDLAERSPLRAVLIYWRAAFLGVQGGNNYDFTLGPLLVLLPAALVAAWRRLPKGVERLALATVGVLVLAGYAGWVALVFTSSLADQARLFFAMLPPLALLAAAGFSAVRGLDTSALRVSVVVTGGLVLALGLSALEAINHFVSQQPLAYLTGGQPAQDYEVSQLGGYPLVMALVNALPSGARIEFLWEARSRGGGGTGGGTHGRRPARPRRLCGSGALRA
jgi:hypothetical protein